MFMRRALIQLHKQNVLGVSSSSRWRRLSHLSTHTSSKNMVMNVGLQKGINMDMTVRSKLCLFPTQGVMHFSSMRHDSDDQNNKKPSRLSSALVSTVAAGSLLLGKTKYLLVALKLTKATPLISMIITSGAYSLIFGWPYALGMVGLIFAHETGHALVMHRYGVPFSPMVFIPFVGAVIAMKETPRSAYEDAIIAFGGPVLGSVAAGACALAAPVVDSQLLYALADFGFMINLFNLIPIGTMDGGRIADAISPYIGVAGLVGGAALIYNGIITSPIFYLIMAGGAYSTGKRFYTGESSSGARDDGFYRIGRAKQASLLAAYASLIAALLLAMKENNKHRRSPKQIQNAISRGWDVDERPPWEEPVINYDENDDAFKDLYKQFSAEQWTHDEDD